MSRHLSPVTSAIAALVLYINGAHAQILGPVLGARDTSCPPQIGDKKVEGNLQIAAPCELDGTEVRGDVILYAGGSLIAHQVHIRGNLVGSRADFVAMDRSRVEGDIRLEELVGDLTSIEQTDVHRSVLLQSNRSRLELLNNDVNGGVQVLGNTGGVLIAGNIVDKDLECAANTPAPLGVGNRVQGEMAGQCENLLAEAPPSPIPTPTPAPTPSPEPSPGMPAPPPTSGSPPAPSTPASTFVPDPEGGGGGAMGWPAALLLPLLVWRRFSRGQHAKPIR